MNKAAAKWSVPANIISAVISAESSGNPKAVSSAGAQGLMQLMPATAKGLGVTNSFDPAQNINGGVQYLKGLLDTYDGNLAKALAGYNAGGNRVKKAVAQHGSNWLAYMPQETQGYVSKIMKTLNGG
ncbi:lytic transglycosylase domain-containing protein [Paenibacillus sp. P22]|uniref:lytic transglycosylase domain-containing protein n=1 Tax=Paenibacillus sp. P22 TaxID=483908 RepID=UPI0022B6E64F|nr:lytic transglycosylase domain-containing protein [Paenibacillus sp. P22]